MEGEVDGDLVEIQWTGGNVSCSRSLNRAQVCTVYLSDINGQIGFETDDGFYGKGGYFHRLFNIDCDSPVDRADVSNTRLTERICKVVADQRLFNAIVL